MNRNLKTAAFSLTALLFLLSLYGTAFGQRDRSDRPGPNESRAVQGREIVDRDNKKAQETPAEFIDREMRRHPTAPTASRLSAARGSFPAFSLGNSPEDKLVQAIEEARTDYAGKFKNEPDSYFESHTKLRLHDFARAYVIALNPTVKARFGDGFALAEERAKATTYDSYEEILRREVPGLSEQAIKDLVKGAKTTVKELIP